jgi:hypothetical protein
VFGDDFERIVEVGRAALAESRVAFVGLARNCATHLAGNLARLEILAQGCRDWRLHIETNDNEDATDQVLADFCGHYRRATFTSQRLNRQQFTAEFAGQRTQALAEYRTACQRWVAENAADADLVVVVDWDAWGGWSHVGLLHGVGSLLETPDAFGMASVSLMQHMQLEQDREGIAKTIPAWLHYDAWALRLNSSFDDYTAGMGGWKHHWIPPIGSPPVPVCSAFGGMAIYEPSAYLAGTYDGSDCEHVTYHASVAAKTGRRLYLNPSMRMVMHWIPEADNGGQHDDH